MKQLKYTVALALALFLGMPPSTADAGPAKRLADLMKRLFGAAEDAAPSPGRLTPDTPPDGPTGRTDGPDTDSPTAPTSAPDVPVTTPTPPITPKTPVDTADAWKIGLPESLVAKAESAGLTVKDIQALRRFYNLDPAAAHVPMPDEIARLKEEAIADGWVEWKGSENMADYAREIVTLKPDATPLAALEEYMHTRQVDGPLSELGKLTGPADEGGENLVALIHTLDEQRVDLLDAILTTDGIDNTDAYGLIDLGLGETPMIELVHSLRSDFAILGVDKYDDLLTNTLKTAQDAKALRENMELDILGQIIEGNVDITAADLRRLLENHPSREQTLRDILRGNEGDEAKAALEDWFIENDGNPVTAVLLDELTGNRAGR